MVVPKSGLSDWIERGGQVECGICPVHALKSINLFLGDDVGAQNKPRHLLPYRKKGRPFHH